MPEPEPVIVDDKDDKKNQDLIKEHMIPKSRFDQVVGQRKEAEAAIQVILDGMIEDIPEDKRDIIPDLSPAKKIAWLTTAKKQGFFDDKQIESPDSIRPGGKAPTDFDNMTPAQRMATGYKT